jgi:homocysteine S-methyltransferase
VKFTELISGEPCVLAEGSVIERLRRGKKIALDPQAEHALLIYDPEGRKELERLWRGYADVGREFSLPMILLSPTWRASEERLRAAGHSDVEKVNRDGVRFLTELRGRYGEYSSRIFIGGLIGCRGDAYQAAEALSEREAVHFHARQIRALAEAETDFLMAATLPALSEAVGMARAMAETGKPYVLSFVIRASGSLLDGTPLSEAVAQIDAEVTPRPAGYMINCVHPQVFAEAMEHECARQPDLRERIIGLQANTSRRSPEELDQSAEFFAESPENLAEGMLNARHRFGTRILGGCCGTGERHIRAIAERLTT